MQRNHKEHHLQDFQRLCCPCAEFSVADFFLNVDPDPSTNIEKCSTHQKVNSSFTDPDGVGTDPHPTVIKNNIWIRLLKKNMIRPHLYFFLFISYKSTWLINYCLIIILVNEKLIIIHSFRYMQKKIKKKHNLKDFQRLYCPWAEISVADFFLEYWSGSEYKHGKNALPFRKL